MNSTKEFFTLETLAEFYADAAKLGGMEYFGYARWDEVFNGPNLTSVAADWRPKHVPPIVRWLVRFEDKTPYPKVFDTEREALMFEANNPCWPRAKIIKLVEEI